MRRSFHRPLTAPWLVLLLVCAPTLYSRQKPTPAAAEASRELGVIRREWDKAQEAYQSALRGAKSADEFQRLSAENRPDPKPYAARFMKLADACPGTYAEADALYWVICHAEGTEHARAALSRFKDGPIAKADLRQLWGLLFIRGLQRAAALREVTPLVYDRVAKAPDHPKASDLLIWVCQAAANDPSPEGAKLRRRAADLLVSRFADAKHLWLFCPLLERDADPAWAERHLRAVLKKNKVPAAGVTASFALASILQNKDVASQAEAEGLYRRVIKDAGPAAREWGKVERHNSLRLRESFIEFTAEEDWVRRAQLRLDEMKARGLGKPAPELAGEDLDGKPIRLSDYRGKVVLLSFWATWCPPCMALVSRERELARRLGGKPFALVGVNGDDDPAKARKVAAAKGMTWRSLKDKQREGAASKAWALEAWPTLYLIDHKGAIRKRWVGAPGDDLDREVDRAISAIRKGE